MIVSCSALLKVIVVSGLLLLIRSTTILPKRKTSVDCRRCLLLRGGELEERYSRQVYTLGTRAHALVRSCAVLLDGPPASGLVYECAKNLVLSGVGQLVLLTDQTSSSAAYHAPPFDDLGTVYRRASRAEHGEGDAVRLLMAYLHALNPTVRLRQISRHQFLSSTDPGVDTDTIPWHEQNYPVVLLCVDRSLSTQIALNEACRSRTTKHGTSIPFVSVETAGVYGRAFNDFGLSFQVVDEDGETPKSTLLDRVTTSTTDHQSSNKHFTDDSVVVHCVEGERHDVSKGDRIVFQWLSNNNNNNNNSEEEEEWEVLYVKNPTCFTIRQCNNSTKRESLNPSYLSNINNNANAFVRKKVPSQIDFLSLADALQQPMFAASDLDKSFDPIRRSAIMSSFAALDTFAKTYSSLPTDTNLDQFIELAKKRATRASGEDQRQTTEWLEIVKSFGKFAMAKFIPLQAFFGAIGAQEALKAASGLYNPIHQFLLYDCEEVLKQRHCDKKASKEKPQQRQQRHCDKKTSKEKQQQQQQQLMAGMSYILGKSFTKKLATHKIFVVGSGAIGCEILKNLSAMGAGTMKSGYIYLTDMDKIERSNLSRQLLFRDRDVGKFKSMAALEAVYRFNPYVHMKAYTNKVGDTDDDGGPFDDDFWEKGINVIMNALDNVEARLYMDSKCVAHAKAMIDAGTLGSKGNVQVVVPNQSESYGSSIDPPEPAIPVCTLKNFPYEISHTIQWGRDLFDGYFCRRPRQVNDSRQALLDTPTVENFAKFLLTQLGEDAALQAAEEMKDDFADIPIEMDTQYFSKLRSESLTWAIEMANSMFCVAMKDLLTQHPVDSVDEDGKPFWSGTRRMPKVLTYSIRAKNPDQKRVNEYIIDFVRAAARLRIETYMPGMGMNGTSIQHSNISVNEAISALETTAHLSLWSVKSDSSPPAQNDQEEGTMFPDIISELAEKLTIAKANIGNATQKLYVAEFEKDDETNGHVAFVTAASNLRALCYGIAPADAMETRRIAGRIVPAMITTTALVSALSCMELVKLLQKAPLRLHKNAFVNLALPFFAFTSPMPAEESIMMGMNGGTGFTIWDRITVKESQKMAAKGGMKLHRFLRKLQTNIESNSTNTLEISSVSYGPYMLYANFLQVGDDTILNKPVWQIVMEAILSTDDEGDEARDDMPVVGRVEVEHLHHDSNDDGPTTEEKRRCHVRHLEKKSFLDFSVIVEDPNTCEEIELPPVRFMKWRGDQ